MYCCTIGPGGGGGGRGGGGGDGMTENPVKTLLESIDPDAMLSVTSSATVCQWPTIGVLTAAGSGPCLITTLQYESAQSVQPASSLLVLDLFHQDLYGHRPSRVLAWHRYTKRHLASPHGCSSGRWRTESGERFQRQLRAPPLTDLQSQYWTRTTCLQ